MMEKWYSVLMWIEEWELKDDAIRKYNALVPSIYCFTVLPGQESRWLLREWTTESNDNQTTSLGGTTIPVRDKIYACVGVDWFGEENRIG